MVMATTAEPKLHTTPIHINGGENASIGKNLSRNSTLVSSNSQEGRGSQPRPRLRLREPPREGFVRQSSGRMNFDKLRRLSRAYDLPRLARMKRLDYRQLFDRFTRQSTIHGVCHAGHAEAGKLRYFWYMAFFICLTLLVFQVMLLLKKYSEYPKNVDLDLKFENAPFPSVTLCNLNPFKSSSITNDASTRATMEAFQNILSSGGQTDGVAAALSAYRKSRRPRRQLSNESKQRRYHQVYAQCYCEINRLSGERKKGSCFAAYKGKISLNFAENQLHNFHPSKCLCQLDAVSKTLWPCFPYNTWKERMCAECRAELGHCPMRFYNGSQEAPKVHEKMDVCLCHNEYNHCISNNENGEIPEIVPSEDIESLDFHKTFSIPYRTAPTMTTTTTTQAPEIRQAMGFDELKDEIAISTQAKQNLMFAVGEKPIRERISLSQSLHELVLKCSFNQRDCDIDKDFKLHYDQSYGNCYTFNWNRTKAVTAHRAGANYGLRVMLYANISEYLPTSEAVGFRITVHDKWIVPFPDAFGYSAPTGFMSSFGVRMKQFNRLSAPHGHCLHGGEDDTDYLYKGFNYSVEGCHRSCTQKEVVRVCGCADPMYPIIGKTKPCSVSDPSARECIKNTTVHLGQLIAEGNIPNCICHQPCRETGYEVTYSAARWPSGTTKLMECEVTDDLCMEKYRKNAAMIQVFYEELNYETLTESPSYTFASLLADLGGVTGLWIGASVVSLLEIIVLIYYCSQSYVKKRKQSVPASTYMSAFPPKKRSASSSVASRPMRKKTPSSSKSLSKHSVLDDEPNKLPPVISESEHQSSSEEEIERKYSSPYLPPGAELPCICLYDMEGRIQRMKALCPEHGYMVRRGTGYSCSEVDEEEVDINEPYIEGDWED